MLTLQTLIPKEFFKPPYFKNQIQEYEFATFKAILKNYAQTLQKSLQNKSTSERSIATNELKDFFSALGFQPRAEQENAGKKSSAIDLALLKDERVEVIIESKLPTSKGMLAPDNVVCDSLCEVILYYFRERKVKNNPHIKHIIITDFTKFYIFKSVLFEKLFYENKAILAQCQSLLDSTNELITNQEKLYKELKNVLDSMSGSLECFCIDLQTLQFDDYQSLKPVFKALHRDFLLDEFNPNDANILNKRFYDELLYILGLSEVKVGDKILIQPSQESEAGANTLYKCIIDKLPQEQRDFDFAMGFVILWLNRILFLKLIEANLVRFNNDKNLKFLNLTKIPNFKTLSYLFFEILSKKPNDAQRGKDSNLSFLPYLNSNLFDKQPCEAMLDIAMLNDEVKLAYFPQTQIKDAHSKQKRGEIRLLEYMFEFLDSFDFGSDEEEGELAHQKELISSSVLGLVFEKLNGYKEGSFFTPSFITSYMCRVSLEKVVLQKFSEIGLNAPDLESLTSQILMNVNADFNFRQKALGVLQSIKICDPAVGSGHFLVSALCEMIGIYRKLGLADDILNACEIAINNDEVHISQNGKNFTYQKPNANNQNHRIQVALFELKKSIIENNLFGVDINPNSVEICKLRLWIELLKNSYYLTQGDEGYIENLHSAIHQMQTLPNIDINIKCGNSLISRFDLKDSLRHIPNIDKQIKDYQQLVFNYKNSDKSELKPRKKDIESKIQNLKATFRLTLKDPKTKKELEKAIKNHINNYGSFLLDDTSLLDGLQYSLNLFGDEKLDEAKQQEAFASFGHIKFLRHKLDSVLSGAEYKNAFEWRLEFPEVLNDSNGDFMGFDLVIGNPPYVVKKKNEYPQYQWNSDLYTMFFEMGFKVVKPNYYVHFITPRFWLVNESLESMRKYFLQHINLLSLSESNPFTHAKTENVISEIQVCAPNQSTIRHCKETDEIFNFIDNIQKDIFASNAKNEIIFNVDKGTIALFDKICQNKIALKDIMQTKRGAEYGKDFIKGFKKGVKILLGGEVKAYSIAWDKTYADSKLKDIKRLSEFFKQEDLIYLRRVDKRLSASMGSESYAFTKNIYGIQITEKKYNPKFILGLLNSKLLNFYYLRKFTTKKEEIFPEIQTYLYEQLPIPKLNAKNKKIADNIINLVNEILESKAKDSTANTAKLESKIDDLVYKLYALDSTEIEIIES